MRSRDRLSSVVTYCTDGRRRRERLLAVVVRDWHTGCKLRARSRDHDLAVSDCRPGEMLEVGVRIRGQHCCMMPRPTVGDNPKEFPKSGGRVGVAGAGPVARGTLAQGPAQRHSRADGQRVLCDRIQGRSRAVATLQARHRARGGSHPHRALMLRRASGGSRGNAICHQDPEYAVSEQGALSPAFVTRVRPHRERAGQWCRRRRHGVPPRESGSLER